MPVALDWKPGHCEPDGVETASAGGITYSVTSWHQHGTSLGAHLARAGDLELGTFPYTADGKRAAFTACESYAQFVADSLRAQATIAD